jgi:hypothetical protein
MSECGLHEHLCTERHSLLGGVKKVYIRTVHIYRPIWVKSSARNLRTVLSSNCDFSRKSAQARRKRNYIYACTVKPYEILTVKNALVKPLRCDTKYKFAILSDCAVC